MTIARVIAAAAAVVLLAGCAPTALASTPRPTITANAPSPTPTPTPTPTAVAERLVLGSESLTVIASDGSTVQTFTYFDAVDQVVLALTALFGAAPAVEDTQPYESYLYTKYSWDGFELADSVQEVEDPYYPNFRVSATVEGLNGIHLETVDGISVSDDGDTVEAAYPDKHDRFTPPNMGYEIFLIHVDRVALPDYVGSDHTYAAELYTLVRSAVGGAVEELNAPMGGGPGI